MNALEDELRSTLNRAAGLTAPGAGFAADALVRGRALRRRRRTLASTAVAGVATVVLAVSLLGNPVTGTSPAPAGPTKGPVLSSGTPTPDPSNPDLQGPLPDVGLPYAVGRQLTVGENERQLADPIHDLIRAGDDLLVATTRGGTGGPTALFSVSPDLSVAEPVTLPGSEQMTVRLDPSGRWAVWGRTDGSPPQTVSLYDRESGRLVKRLQLEHEVRVLAVTADEALLADEAEPMQVLWRWRFAEDRIDPVLGAETERSPQILAVRSDGARAVLGEFGEDPGCIVEGSLRPWRQGWRICGFSEPGVTWSPSGSTMLLLTREQKSQVVDARTGRTISTLGLPPAWGQVRGVAWRDEDHLVVGMMLFEPTDESETTDEPSYSLATCTISSGECKAVATKSASPFVLPR